MVIQILFSLRIADDDYGDGGAPLFDWSGSLLLERKREVRNIQAKLQES